MWDSETKERTTNQKQKILHMFRSAGEAGVLNIELVTVALQYQKRLSELYYMGYKIENEDLGKGLVRYVLIAEPINPIKIRPKAYDILLEKIKESGVIDAEQFVFLLDKLQVGIKYNTGVYKNS